MDFWAGAEVEKSVHHHLKRVREELHNGIEGALQSGLLADVQLELCYIPIVMDKDFIDLYPERATFDKRAGKVLSSPHLDFAVFKSFSLRSAQSEYLRGLSTASRILSKAGLEAKTIDEFKESVLSVCVD